MALREILARFGIQVDAKQLAVANTGILSTIGSLRTFGAVIAGSVIIRGIKNFVTEIVNAGDNLGKASTQLGLSSDELQNWRFAADLAGVEASAFDQSMRVLQKNAFLAAEGSKQSADAFKTLGIDIKDANGQLKDGNVLVTEVGLALNKLESSTERVALAQVLMGRTGAKLLPLFKDGAEGLAAALSALDKFGGGLSKDLIPLAEEAQDRFTEFNAVWLSFKSRLATAVLPILNQVVAGLSKFGAAVSKALDGTNALQAVLGALGAILGRLGFSALAKLGMRAFIRGLLRIGRAVLIPLAKFALLTLVIDDLITLFQGGESLIGNVIDKIFGEGSAKALIDGIKGVGTAISDVLATGDFKKFDEELEDIFGPPGEALITGAISIFDEMAIGLGKAILDLGEGLVLMASDLVQFFVDVGEDFAEAGDFLAEDAAELAESIIDGLVDGLEDGASAVVKAIVDVAKGAIDAAKGIFKPGSPSRVFFEMGQQNIQGLVGGTVRAARALSGAGASAVAQASGLGASSVSASARGGAGGGGAGRVIFKTEINIPITGGAPNDPQIAKLRQTMRRALDDNRRATLAALEQVVEVA